MLRVFHFVVVLTFLPLLTWAAGSREVHTGPPPAWVHPAEVPNIPKTPDASVQRHYLLFETQQDVATNALYTHSVYRLLTAEGVADGSQVTIDFDPAYETVTLHSAHLIRDGRVIEQLDPKKIQILQREADLEYLVYNGDLSALLIFEDVRVGDVVEFAYTRVGANPVFGGKYLATLTLDWGMPISLLRLRVLVPNDRKVAYHKLGPVQISPTVEHHGDTTELEWTARDVPATTGDNHTPGWFDGTPRVILTEYPSWESVVNWALPLYARSPSPSGPLHERAEAIKASARDDQERALLALKYVQSEIRYLGIEQGVSSHQPSACEDVMRRGFGDCKDKARLLTNLLQELGFEAAPVFVHTARKQMVAKWAPTPYAFNHVIVQLRLAGRTFFLDPTLRDQAGGLPLRHTTRYRAGLVISPGTTEITQWPESDNDLYKTTVREEFSVPSFEAKTQLTIRSTYGGRSAENIRSEITGTTKEKIGKEYLDFYARYFPEITQAAPVSWTDIPERNEFVVEERYMVPPMFSKSDNGVWVADFHPSNLDEYLASPGAGGRKTPLAVSFPVALNVETHVTLPEKWNVPVAQNAITASAFKYDRRRSGHDREVEWNYTFRTTADHVDPDGFSDYARALKTVKDDIGGQLTFTPPTAAAAPAYKVNWAMAALAVFWTVASAIGAFLCLRRPPAATEPPVLADVSVPPEPYGLGGWLALVGFGVVVRPLALLVTIFPSLETYFNLNTWRLLTTPGTEYAKPAFAIAAPVEMSINFILLFSSWLLVALYFGRRRLFPAVMMGFLALMAVSTGFQLWATGALGETSAGAAGTFVQTLLVCVIWIPYFCVSKRVRNTFTR